MPTEKPLRLSEAIRLGSMLKPQAFTQPLMDDTGGACAMEAARLAVNGVHWSLSGEYPWLRNERTCPASSCRHAIAQYSQETFQVIAHLNDTHEWTRERIADWVEQIENQESETSAECEAAEIETLK